MVNQFISRIKIAPPSLYVFLCIGILLTIFFFLTPLVVDDYTFLASWRSIGDWQRFIDLNAYFYNEINGRILGNLSSLVLASNREMSAIFRSLVLVGIIILSSKLLNIRSPWSIALVSAVLFFVPVSIFSETIAWRAGFYNYVTPVLLILSLGLLLLRIYQEKHNLKILTYIMLFVGALAGSLFAENITLMILGMGSVGLFVSLVWCKRMVLPVVSVMAGSIAGMVTMFLSPVYGRIVDGGDGYREVAGAASSGFLETVRDNFLLISDSLLTGHIPLITVLAIPVFILLVKRRFIKYRRVTSVLLIASAWYLSISSFLVTSVTAQTTLGTLSVFIECAMLVLFYACIIYTIARGIRDRESRIITIALLLAALMSVVPLVIVDPISPRIFFVSYVLQSLVALKLIHSVITFDLKLSTYDINQSKRILVAVSALAFMMYAAVFCSIRLREAQNEILAKDQIAAGKTLVILKKYPFEQFTYGDKYLPKWPRMYYANCECTYTTCSPCGLLNIRYQ